MSNRLIDILDDEKKVDGMNTNYHYRQSVLPRLEKLRRIIWDENIPGITNDEQDKDLEFDPEKILSLITDKTKLIILINPIDLLFLL